jgi:hypothetical protein
MSRNAKAYWEMTMQEVQQTTKEFDEEFVADTAKLLTKAIRARWERAKHKTSAINNGKGYQTIPVRLEKTLLHQCTKLAKKKRTSRDALIARGLKALLAAECEVKKE